MADKDQKLKRWLSTAVKFLIAIGLIVWMERRGSLNFSLLWHMAHPAYLFPAFFALFLNLFINNFRWVLLMRGQGFQIGIWETLQLSFIGLFFNYAMPGGVGGDIVKGYYVMQAYPTRRTAAAASVLMDRLVGFLGMIVISLGAILINLNSVLARQELISLAIGVLGVGFAFAVFFGVAFSRRIYSHPFVDRVLAALPAEKMVRKIYDTVHSYRQEPRFFWWALFWAVVSQFAMLGFFMVIGEALDIEKVGFFTYAFVIPLGIIASAVPISPAGVGVGQAIFLFLFNLALGHSSALGPSLITAHQLVSFVLGLAGAYFYFRRKRPNFEEVTA